MNRSTATPQHRRTVLVTGSSRGIGKAICREFLASGWRVIGVDIAPAAIRNSDYHHIRFDLVRSAEKIALRELKLQVDQITRGFLDALINNAAVQIVKPAAKLTADDWRTTLRVNLTAPFFLTQAFLPMLRRARGSVVNIASIHACLTKPGFAAYAASKGALVSLTQALALELAPRVRVNAVLPAATDTKMLRDGIRDAKRLKKLGKYHPLGRIARPEEVAKVVLFLAGNGADFMTGATVAVDGGIGALLHDPEGS